MHLATLERFADEIPAATLEYEAATYYANIVLPYSPIVLKALEKVAASGLKIKIIAPDHGPIWRKDIGRIIELYKKWALQKPTAKAVVVYATMWHSTEKMASAISEALAQAGVKVKLLSMNETHRSEVVYEVLDAGALIVGSPTLNNNILPQMADVMTYLKGLKPANLIGAAFGSYGWSGESVKAFGSNSQRNESGNCRRISLREKCSRQQCFGKMSRIGENHRGGVNKESSF